ncbi:MAG: preprotein translocase subunit SecA, partial [Proteobacteria bacterium]|nr:preprotein translocase subunit SecA [Pseudomonadota bacterium]
EMRTGDGKTLAATMPLYLNALTGRGTHVVTVNDYLAQRDSEWMGAIYKFLGLTVGVIVNDMDDDARHAAYRCDVTYGTNNEFGFDYLRDNMKYDTEEFVQRDFHYAIVDEVDSILIDEARTPLIISGPSEESTDQYYRINRIIPRLNRETDYTIDEKQRTSVLTEEGVAKCEKLLKVDNLYDPKHIELIHHVNQALKAHVLFARDKDYIVQDGEVIIVDEFTGRLMPGRRFSDGLHQALEAKEAVKIEAENQTLATITFQNFFRMYDKLAGMTGTADTEAAEFKKIYKLDVVVIPTHMEMIRTDFPDQVYASERDKFEAVTREIEDLHRARRPVLVGTVSVEKSERLAKMLKKRGVPHEVLNAKNHAREAEIVAQAGQPGVVTISTNMAGRGTDIVLGQGVAPAGGLHIVGTERHESRRVDNQLRGRSGRQGDPGSSRFFLSLEDDLLRIFGSERIKGLMGRLGLKDGEPIEAGLLTKAIENAQRRVEGHNFEIRKHLLEYDDVMNQQREVIYTQRKDALKGDDLSESIREMIDELARGLFDTYLPEDAEPAEWDLEGLSEAVWRQFGFRLSFDTEGGLARAEIIDGLLEAVQEAYQEKEREIGPETMRFLERMLMLQAVDGNWKDHLLNMDHLKEGIGLRGYGQMDPLREYKKEAYAMFADMFQRIKDETIGTLFLIQLEDKEAMEAYYAEELRQEMALSHPGGDGGEEPKAEPVRKGQKVGRNAPCPCGSGKKYKKCCGREAA